MVTHGPAPVGTVPRSRIIGLTYNAVPAKYATQAAELLPGRCSCPDRTVETSTSPVAILIEVGRAHQVRPRALGGEHLVAVPAQHQPGGQQHIVDQPAPHCGTVEVATWAALRNALQRMSANSRRQAG